MTETMGTYVRRHRKKQGLTRKELSRILKVTENTIARIEEDDGILPDDRLVVGISKALRCNTDVLLRLRANHSGVPGIYMLRPPVRKTHGERIHIAEMMARVFAEEFGTSAAAKSF